MSEIEEVLDPILATFRAKLETTLANHAVEAYLQGSAQMVSWGRTQKGLAKLYEGPPMRQAIDYANTRAARLVTEMDTATKDRLAKIIGDGIKNKRGVPGLARDIRREFADMTKYRSELIAKTETRDSLFHASQDRMKGMGVTGKRWILGAGGSEGNCSDCIANAEAGAISVNDDFPTSQYSIHPGCLCALAPVMLE